VDVPRILRAILLSAGLAAAASLLVAAYLDSSLQSEQQQLQRRISQRRAALRLDPNAGGSGMGLLAKRKQATPSRVMVLEAISRVLPDTTYVTELRIEGDKVQVVGMTQDAPSLIRLMEQSPQFTRANLLCAHHARAERTGRTLPHRGAYHGLFRIRHMNAFAVSGKTITTSPILAAAIYAGLVVVLLFTVVTSIADVVGQRDEVASASGMLEQLEGRRAAAVRGPSGEVTMPSGSAFLEGATVTIAGATLLQRVAGAVTKFGGNVLSTQLDLQGTQSKSGIS